MHDDSNVITVCVFNQFPTDFTLSRITYRVGEKSPYTQTIRASDSI